jgi:iron complex transport system substrate-binding protein
VPRIASLLPAATEMVYAMGLGSHLVARSHECDYPLPVKKLPSCTSPTIDVDKSSAEIDLQVKTHLSNGLSIFNVDFDLLRTLNVDFIITQSHCDVCAVSEKDIARQVQEKCGAQVKIISLNIQSLSHVWGAMRQIATALNAEVAAEEKINQYQRRMIEIQQKVTFFPKPTVACIEWIDPLMSAGNWVPELVAMAGGVNLFGEAGKHSPWLEWNRVVEKDPDYVLVLPCGFDLKRTRREIGPLINRPEWLGLRAVQYNRAFLLDGNQYFNRPGPRLLESLEILAEVFHPEAFDFGHRYQGWEYLGILS